MSEQREGNAVRVSSEGATYDWLLLGDAVDRAASKWGNRPAVIFGDRQWSYADFAAEVDRVAKGLMALGAQIGDHVAVWMTNLPEWLWLQYAIPKVGGCIVPLNTRYRTDDVAYTAAQSESRFMISIDQSGPIDFRQMLCEAYAEIAGAGHLGTVGAHWRRARRRLGRCDELGRSAHRGGERLR